jgi:hypothetical protein
MDEELSNWANLPTTILPLKFLETKNWSTAVWAACVKKNIFFQFFLLDSELHIPQAFREHQARPIPTLYDPVANFC